MPTNPTERILLDALHRIIVLEERVDLLEAVIKDIPAHLPPEREESDFPDDRDTEFESGMYDENIGGDEESVRQLYKAFTRSQALELLKAEVKSHRADLTIVGKLNRGNNPLRIVTSDGDEHRIYFSASRNYDDSDDGRFVGWLTIAIDDIKLANYETFVFAIQDVAENFHYLIFTHQELEKLVDQKYQPDSRGYIHFSIAGDSAYPGKYAQLRGEPTDFTPYANAWRSLPSIPPF